MAVASLHAALRFVLFGASCADFRLFVDGRGGFAGRCGITFCIFDV